MTRKEWPTAGRNDVFTAFYDRFAERGVNYAFGLLHNRSDSEDVIQDAFCRLMATAQRQRLLENENEFAAVFFTAVRNLAIDMLRRRQRRRHEPLDEARATPARQTDFSEEEVRDLLAELPNDWREALQLRVDGKLSYAQIAEVLDCTVAQVRTWVYRARNQLAAELQGRGIPVHRRAI